MRDLTVAETTAVIEEFMVGLQYETRLYPDLWSLRLAMILNGDADPGPIRTNEQGVAIFVSTGLPVHDHTNEA